jgi:hypothetical protein
MKEVEFVVPFSQRDRYRHCHVRLKGRVIDFSVQYETFLNGEWIPVVRYDTSHGFAHRDLMDRKGQTRKTPLFIADMTDALTFAESDIRDNWEIYRERFTKETEK